MRLPHWRLIAKCLACVHHNSDVAIDQFICFLPQKRPCDFGAIWNYSRGGESFVIWSQFSKRVAVLCNGKLKLIRSVFFPEL